MSVDGERLREARVAPAEPARLSEVTFNQLVESGTGALVLVNEAGHIAFVNRRCEALFRYPAAELIGQPVSLLWPERLRGTPQLGSAAEAGPEARSGDARELWGRRRDGGEFPIEIEHRPIVLLHGSWTVVSIVDLSRHKRAEARFRQVVEHAPNAMLLVDELGVITLANRQALDLFGYAEHELLRQPVDALLPAALRGGHGAHLRAFFHMPQARRMGLGRALRACRKNGEEFPIEIGLNPLMTEDGPMALASIIDISERVQHEEMRARKEAAEAASQAKSELLAIASHDLKNPLAAIAGLADVLLESKRGESEPPSEDIALLETIHDAARHMSEVIAGILANEGLEQQGLRAPEALDLGQLAEEVVRFNLASARRKDIDLVRTLADGLVVRADRTRLREAMDNYVSNALKYSPAGRRVAVSLSSSPCGGWVEFGVRDQGPGLTDEDRAKLFGKFKRLSAKPTGGESSTGLGLSIVKSIVELHGGQVGCDSEPGRGAYFWARLPRAVDR